MSQSQTNLNSDMSLEHTKTEEKNYELFLYNSTEPLFIVKDISAYVNLSGYISVFVNDIKDNKILLPDFVKEQEMKLIVEFIESYKDTTNYKFNEVTGEYKIDIEKPVKDLNSLKKKVGDCYKVIETIFSKKMFLSVMNSCMCLDIPILTDIICAKIALDVKYMIRSEINEYFQEAKSK
jgi:hypothetical protein